MHKVIWMERWLLIARQLSRRYAGVKAMTKRQEEARQSLVEIVGYFKMVAEDWDWHSWRKSEYEVASAVANLISTKDKYTKADFEEIASCVNVIVRQKHADGSGWMNFQSRINIFYSAFGYESKWGRCHRCVFVLVNIQWDAG